MTISMYDASIPVFVRFLTNLSGILKKGATHAEAKKFDPSVLVNARLAPDMFALARQVQIACDVAKGATARLAGIEIPKFEDNETTFEQLEARIRKTLDFIQSVTPAQINGSEDRDIVLPLRGQETHFKGLPYLLTFATPNVYFHVVTAYDILRHNGVELGKPDFLGAM